MSRPPDRAVGLSWEQPLAGRIEHQVIESAALAGNPLGDPAQRPLWVYLPPGYDDDPGRHYPTVYVLQGYMGQVAMWGNRSAFRRPYPETADRLFASAAAPPCVVVYVDAWTTYGGSQFVDSPGTGQYHRYLCEDVVSFVDANYRTLDDADHRGVQGHSSGGFGALVSAMLRPDLFGGLASHAGDALYELCYIPEFAKAARLLREFDGSIDRWWEDFRRRVAFTRPGDETLVMLLGVAACFSAAADASAVLPFDTATGEPAGEAWQRWLAWDPVRMIPLHASALGGLRAAWIDAGRSDEWNLDLGAVALQRALREAGVRDVAFELFDGGHSRVDYRYPLALSYLAHRLA